jgi:predicted nucleic acid-binding protein
MSFLSAADPETLHLSVLSLGELRKGVAHKKASDPETAGQLSIWVDGLEYSFADRVLTIDAQIARVWGELSAERPRPVIDTLLAATALVHGLTLVTRNTNDVAGIGIDVINPWKP